LEASVLYDDPSISELDPAMKYARTN
jgi:hypothetical protein